MRSAAGRGDRGRGCGAGLRSPSSLRRCGAGRSSRGARRRRKVRRAPRSPRRLQRAARGDAGPELRRPRPRGTAWRRGGGRAGREPSLRRRAAGAPRPCPCGRGGIAAPRKAPASSRPAPERAECGARGAPRPGLSVGRVFLSEFVFVLRANVVPHGGSSVKLQLYNRVGILSVERGQRGKEEEQSIPEGELGFFSDWETYVLSRSHLLLISFGTIF